MQNFQTYQPIPPPINPLPPITNYFSILPLGSSQTITQQQLLAIWMIPSINYLAPIITQLPSQVGAQPPYVRKNVPSHNIASIFPPPPL